MDAISKSLLLLVVVLILILMGYIGAISCYAAWGFITGNINDGVYGLVFATGVTLSFSLSPSLLLPYCILFWRKKSRILASLIAAIICGTLYPVLLFLLTAVAWRLNLHPEKTFIDWVTGSVLALIPGTALAYLGTRFGEGFHSRSKKAN